jgi:chromosome segregation ATPase
MIKTVTDVRNMSGPDIAEMLMYMADLKDRLEAAEAQLSTLRKSNMQFETDMITGDRLLKKAEAQLSAMIEGLELQNDASNGTPEALKVTCQVVALAAKKYEPMKAQLSEWHERVKRLNQIIADDSDAMEALEAQLSDIGEFFPVCGEIQCEEQYDKVQAILCK